MGPLLRNALSDAVLTWSAFVLMTLGAVIFLLLAVLPRHVQLKLGVKHLRNRHGTEPAHTLLARFGLLMIGLVFLAVAAFVLSILARS